MKVPLTICIITNRADERFIKSLASAQIAEEVLIIDNESGNNWQELRKRFVFSRKLHKAKIEHFGTIRQEALQQAAHDWVLFLDSDEWLEPTAENELRLLISHNTADGFTITRRDIFLGQPLYFAEGGTLTLLRLVKRQQARVSGSVHETISVTGRVAPSSLLIWHESHLNISEFITDVAHYAKLAAKEKKSKRGQLLFELLTYPLGKWLYNLIIRGGIFDGWRGVTYATVMSLHSLWVRVYRYEQTHS
jgi:glycosyltransferase involved in cell wall biosynthesis